MKKKPRAKKGVQVPLGRWPGAGPAGTRRAAITKRNKSVKVTLAGKENAREDHQV